MKKDRTNNYITAIALVVMMGMFSLSSHAGERIGGGLVFEAMKKIESRQKAFQHDVQHIRAEREQAMKEKELIKKRFLQSKWGSIDRKEAHAELSYVIAKIYRKSFDEFKLVRSTASDHLKALSALRNGLRTGSAGLDQKATRKIVRDTSGFIKSSNSLLMSIGKYTEVITDPMINRKLRAARSTALILDKYVNDLSKDRLTNDTTQQALTGKVEELISRMEELFIQTDIMLDMIKNKSGILKVINQIAISELAAIRLANGRSIVNSISEEVLAPLKEVLQESDNDLDLLTEGMQTGGGSQTAPLDQSWSKGLWD